MTEFKSIQQLETWLFSKNINTIRWGEIGTKTVACLWNELLSGETTLQDEPPLRVIQVVSILIRRNGKVLVEAQQELMHNRLRERGCPPSETMRNGERIADTALRGLCEELGVLPVDVELFAHTPKIEQVISDSTSYPGLRTKYIIYRVGARVKNLPEGSFWTQEAFYSDDSPVMKHHWLWKKEQLTYP